MQCTCPACGFHAPLLSFTAEQAASEFASLMGRVPPPVAHLVEQYLQMFATPKHKPTFAKAVRALKPLVHVIESGKVTHAKREWTVTPIQISEGLTYMVGKRAELTLPLKSHGYLFKVLAGAVDKAEAVTESKGIEQTRQARPAQPATDVPGNATANRTLAVLELGRQIEASRRIRHAVTREQLTAALSKQGFTPGDIEFAFLKVPFKQE